MGVEYTIYCDDCSMILVSASSVAQARSEGRTTGLLHRVDKRDLCSKCYQRHIDDVARLTTTQQQEG